MSDIVNYKDKKSNMNFEKLCILLLNENLTREFISALLFKLQFENEILLQKKY